MKLFAGILGVSLAVILTGCVKPSTSEAPASGGAPAARFAFRDAAKEAPPGWTGPRFTLSHDYPKERPTCEAPWLKRNVSFSDPNGKWDWQWQGYVDDIVKYVFEGQDPDLPDAIGWRASVAGQTRWYYVPWMAYDGQRGREFVHGLTNELSTAQSTFLGRGGGLHTLPTAKKAAGGVDPLFETWSVGFYNPCGGWSIGQGWPASGEPATYTEASGRMFARGMPFPEGTVVVKILNTTADADAVPYLRNSTTWQADAHVQLSPTKYATCDRAVRKVHLIQMDLAVVDGRSPTRWVYSTLAYDGTIAGRTVRERLRPLGVQWGSDPGTFPAVPRERSRAPWQTLLAPIDIYEHYGCEKRLAGIVDQANSSCVSCHMGAYSATPGVLQAQGTNVPAIFSFTGMCTVYNQANAQYFSNYAYPAPYPNGQYDNDIPLDSSLQLQVAFAQYAVFKNPGTKTTCPDPGGKPAAAGAR